MTGGDLLLKVGSGSLAGKKVGKHNRARPASSIQNHKPSLLKNTSNEAQIASINNLRQFVKEANQSDTNGLRSHSQEVQGPKDESNGQKKMFPMKSIKFPYKKPAGNSLGAKSVTFS